MIAVIAGSRRQFDDFMRHWVHQPDQKKFKCVTKIDDVRGWRPIEVIRIGTYYKLRDLWDMEQYLEYRMLGKEND